MLCHRRRRWHNIKPTLVHRLIRSGGLLLFFAPVFSALHCLCKRAFNRSSIIQIHRLYYDSHVELRRRHHTSAIVSRRAGAGPSKCTCCKLSRFQINLRGTLSELCYFIAFRSVPGKYNQGFVKYFSSYDE